MSLEGRYSMARLRRLFISFERRPSQGVAAGV